MRHRKQKATLGRTRAKRKALLRSLADSLVLHGSIKTTRAKAKALRMFVEPLVTKAKTGSLASQRHIRKFLYTDAAVNKIMKELGPRYKERAGGYTRTTKIGYRKNDAAEMVQIEFVD